MAHTYLEHGLDREHAAVDEDDLGVGGEVLVDAVALGAEDPAAAAGLLLDAAAVRDALVPELREGPVVGVPGGHALRLAAAAVGGCM